MLFDIYIGLAWLLGAPRRTATPTLRPARQVFDSFPGDPARSWGALLLLGAIFTALCLTRCDGRGIKGAFALLSGYWCFWFLVDIYASFHKDASLTAPGVIAIVVIGHVRQSLSVMPLARRR